MPLIKRTRVKVIKEFQDEYRWLSNFWECKFKEEGKIYLSVEHYFQSAKTVNEKEQEWVRTSPYPGIAKKRGRQVSLREDWDNVKDNIMKKGLLLKFNQNKKLRDKLKDTYPFVLQEGNSWGDVYWGIDLRSGTGKNKLGLLLMELRKSYL